jgi:hypothetical protein
MHLPLVEVSMFTSFYPLCDRIVSRFLNRQRSYRGHLDRLAFVWKPAAPPAHVPDDFIVECSSGCTLTSEELERMLPASLNVAPRSCRIERVPANAETNRTRFEAATTDGKRVTGTITVNLVASNRRIDAFSVVDLET